ncbi:unnamed protein product [Linum tenue]|uniref:Senescence domain-containing protein n=1 Tax=Linum tenue TaxID=586396 RepID=A0AAV0QFH0_9ROSI|nr:unnamed protein product [Linum tenue]
MGCFRPKRSTKPNSSSTSFPPQSRNLKHEILLQIPSCTLHLMEAGEAMELATGDFTLFRIIEQMGGEEGEEEDVSSLATIVSIAGGEVQWPLTKDEPVVKLDATHYLFSLPMKDVDPLSYGVTFAERDGQRLQSLDAFLGEHSCFSADSGGKSGLEWTEFAPRVEDYNSVLARAIAGGTGQIVRGMFRVSNAYTNQVHKGGEMILTSAAGRNRNHSGRSSSGVAKKTKLNKSLKRVRKLSRMTEKLSKAMLDGVGIATGSVMKPLVKSKTGKQFLSMVPGEVLLASLDAVNKILDAAEAAEKQALSATSEAATRRISNRYGEEAGEAAGDVFASAGHCACAAWNICKIRKAINPASSVSATGMLKTAAKGAIRKS